MKIDIPNVNVAFKKIVKVNSEFDNETKPISEWLRSYRVNIKSNRKLLKTKSDKNDITILIIILREILVRAIKGEAGERVFESLKRHIKTKDDLYEKNYETLLKEAKYRWGAVEGSKTIEDIVKFRHWKEENRSKCK